MGSINNLTIKNHQTGMGPSLTFLHLSNFIKCDNISIFSDSFSIYQGKIGLLWNSYVNFSNFFITKFEGKGFFDIQYHSTINIQNVTITNFTFWNHVKGSFLNIASYSEVYANGIVLTNITSNNSLIYIDNSKIILKFIEMEGLKLSLDSSDKSYIVLDSSDFTLDHASIMSFSMCFLYQQNANVTIRYSYFDNDIKNNLNLALFYSYYPISITINNSIFTNQLYAQGVFLSLLIKIYSIICFRCYFYKDIQFYQF